MMTNVASGPDASVHAARSVHQSGSADGRERLLTAAIDSKQLFRQCVDNINFATSLPVVFDQSCKHRVAKFDGAMIEDLNDVIANEADASKEAAVILASNKLVDLRTALQSAAETDDWYRKRNLSESFHHKMQCVKAKAARE